MSMFSKNCKLMAQTRAAEQNYTPALVQWLHSLLGLHLDDKNFGYYWT